MIEFLQPYMTGDKWEEICTSWYRIKYQDEGFHEIPATYRGDGGIEGYTRTGIVYQCYCPEKEYSDDDLYEHMRKKMSKDIKKLINPEYAKILKKMGIRDIKEWHFIVPENRDKRLLEHKETKRKQVLEYKQLHKEQCDFINDNFEIDIKVAKDFKLQFSQIIRGNVGVKLDLTSLKNKDIDWSDCDSQKVLNVKRKIKAVMGGVDDNDEDYLELVDFYMKSYLTGMQILENLRENVIDIYEQVAGIELAYKNEVAQKTKLNMDSSINGKLFREIMDSFKNTIEQKLPFMSEQSIFELRDDLISQWLADCSMQFRG